MTWQDFLTTLAGGLERLDARLQATAPARGTGAGPDPANPPPPPICLADGHQRAGDAQCLIDVGAHWTPADGAFVPVDHLGICLRDKGLARPGPGRGSVAPKRPTGVTALALDPPPDLFAQRCAAVSLRRWMSLCSPGSSGTLRGASPRLIRSRSSSSSSACWPRCRPSCPRIWAPPIGR